MKEMDIRSASSAAAKFQALPEAQRGKI